MVTAAAPAAAVKGSAARWEVLETGLGVLWIIPYFEQQRSEGHWTFPRCNGFEVGGVEMGVVEKILVEVQQIEEFRQFALSLF